MSNELKEALGLVQECLDDWPNAAIRVIPIMHRLEKVKELLLKEQEAVEPTLKQGEDGIFVWACGSCDAYMYHIYDGIDKAKEYAKYCRQCERMVKWK